MQKRMSKLGGGEPCLRPVLAAYDLCSLSARTCREYPTGDGIGNRRQQFPTKRTAQAHRNRCRA